MKRVSRIPVVAALAALGACASPRPTESLVITFSPSIETEHYRIWDFELESCRDFDDVRFDAAFVREHLLASIREELAVRGFEQRPGEPVDFRVFYELWIADGGDLEGVHERARGRIFARDVASGRLVWRGERKAPIADDVLTRDELMERIQRFTRELLHYTHKLDRAESWED